MTAELVIDIDAAALTSTSAAVLSLEEQLAPTRAEATNRRCKWGTRVLVGVVASAARSDKCGPAAASLRDSDSRASSRPTYGPET